MQANQYFQTAESQNLHLPLINNATPMVSDILAKGSGQGNLKGPKFVKQGQGMFVLQPPNTTASSKTKAPKQAMVVTKSKGKAKRSSTYDQVLVSSQKD